MNWKTDPFLNIGTGVGMLFNQLNRSGYGYGTTLAQWINAVFGYGPVDYNDPNATEAKESLKQFFKFFKLYAGNRFTSKDYMGWYQEFAKYAKKKKWHFWK